MCWLIKNQGITTDRSDIINYEEPNYTNVKRQKNGRRANDRTSEHFRETEEDMPPSLCCSLPHSISKLSIIDN